MGQVLRTTLPTGKGGVVHLFVVYGYQGAEEDADQLLLTDRLLQAVRAEAEVVCVGQPMLIAGDLNADPAVLPCLAKGISAGWFVGLALAYSRGAGIAPDATCRFKREGGAGSRRDFIVGCFNALAASDACFVTDRWFTPHFSVVARFNIEGWSADWEGQTSWAWQTIFYPWSAVGRVCKRRWLVNLWGFGIGFLCSVLGGRRAQVNPV